MFLKTDIIRYYGVPGHGKGEVDSAGGGVKTHLKECTYKTGDFFKNAAEAKVMLDSFRDGRIVRDFVLEGDVSNPADHVGLVVTGSDI